MAVWLTVVGASGHSSVPLWPAYVFGFLAAISLGLALAPVFAYWPYGDPLTSRPARRAAHRWEASAFGLNAFISSALGKPAPDGLALTLTVPAQKVRRSLRVTVVLRHLDTDRTWEPAPGHRNGRECAALFPKSFPGGSLPIPAGLYRSEWTANNRIVATHEFVVRPLGTGYAVYARPTRHLTRVGKRLVRRLLVINDGFRETATQDD